MRKEIDNFRFFVAFGLWGVGILGFLAGSLAGDLGSKTWEYVGHTIGPLVGMTGIDMGYSDKIWGFFFKSANDITNHDD